MKKILIFLLLAIFITTSFGQSKDEAQVRNILHEQTIAWNNGNVENFMQGYWQSDSLMFIGKSGITYGWQKTLDNYKKNYPDATAMGKLDFNLLSVKKISADYFFVIGKWHLARSAGDLNGSFTLLFKKINMHWVIVADHSS